MKKTYLFTNTVSFFIMLLLFSCHSQKELAPVNSPVAKYGKLSVNGIHIVAENSNPVSFAGNSFFWSNPYYRATKFYNKDVVAWLQKDWNSSIIRLPLAADPNVHDSYLFEPKPNLKALETVIDAAIDLGMYVVIDWHSQHAEDNEEQAIAFFKKMATKYGKYPNIIYEIYNEPLKISWTDVIKPYAINVITEIRKIDPDNLIIVGTPHWSQDVDVASKNPIKGFKNIAYTLHFYTGSHFEWLRNKTEIAIKNGLPIFVTEWGTVNADGDGKVHTESVKEWMKLLKKYKISHCNWSINDKEEGASIIKLGANPKGGWTDDELTISGKLAKKYIKNWKN